MAEKKLNIGNLVTPKGASLLFGAETTPDNLEIIRDNEHTQNPYTIIIDEETDENIPADAISYTPPSGSIITANSVQGAINQLEDSLNDVGGVFYAIYGETTSEEIIAALAKGKKIITRLTSEQTIVEFPLVINFNNTIFGFNHLQNDTLISLILDNDGWRQSQKSPFVTTDVLAKTTGEFGITSLSSATDSTDEDKAATPKAVKAAYDLAASKTSNTGTITEIQANGTSIATSGVANIPAASTSTYGVTKLNSATDSTSEIEAATASAVKAAYDLAASKTNNTGTITEVQVNGTSIASSGVANIPEATTSDYGVTKLSSSTSSTSTSLAATSSAVKSAYDLANAAMPKDGGAFTGAISYNGITTVSSSAAYYRPIRVSTSAPTSSDGNVGDIWIQYSE